MPLISCLSLWAIYMHRSGANCQAHKSKRNWIEGRSKKKNSSPWNVLVSRGRTDRTDRSAASSRILDKLQCIGIDLIFEAVQSYRAIRHSLCTPAVRPHDAVRRIGFFLTANNARAAGLQFPSRQGRVRLWHAAEWSRQVPAPASGLGLVYPEPWLVGPGHLNLTNFSISIILL